MSRKAEKSKRSDMIARRSGEENFKYSYRRIEMPMMHSQRPGENGIQDTLFLMQTMVNRSFLNPLIRRLAADATVHCDPADKRCLSASLLAFVQRSMRYVRDPVGVEALHDPIAIAQEIARGGKPFGDCDDFSLFLATLMKSVGLPASFKAVGFNGGNLSHVYVIGPYGCRLDGTRDFWNVRLGELMPETSMMVLQV